MLRDISAKYDKNDTSKEMKKESLYNDNNKENISSNININSKDEIKQKDRKEKIKKIKKLAGTLELY